MSAEGRADAAFEEALMSGVIDDKIIRKSCVVDAPVAEVWRAWTTSEGAQTFFAPRARIELRIGGPYEILFDLSEPPGRQGSEGMRILSYLHHEMLSFTWSAPPQFPTVRESPAPAWVVVQFHSLGPHTTDVTLSHVGWREGDEWNQVYAYFDRAWEMVMRWLHDRFESGPKTWDEA